MVDLSLVSGLLQMYSSSSAHELPTLLHNSAQLPIDVSILLHSCFKQRPPQHINRHSYLCVLALHVFAQVQLALISQNAPLLYALISTVSHATKSRLFLNR